MLVIRTQIHEKVQINMGQELEDIRARYIRVRNRELSEIDTQILLIEPVLEIAGWDVNNHEQVKRAHRRGRGAKMEFDIEVYSSKDDSEAAIAIECKSLESTITLKSRKGVGQLLYDIKTGLWWQKRIEHVGQLRAYCVNYPQFDESSLAVLTNGFDWVIFDTLTFINKSQLGEPILKIMKHSQLTEANFEETVVATLRSANKKKS